uniref:ADP-ribosyl cyclase/cyclic ADP-ribose hydrolase n=1 Tax=Poecilia latipinna TaxID=48699 RepID=A0A3B3TKG1_9TELE
MELKIILAIAGGVLLLAVVVIVPPATLLSPRTSQFRKTFRRRCEAFPQTIAVLFGSALIFRCEEVLSTFEKTYVGKDPCNFPEEAYRPLFEDYPFTHSCDKTMFWSDTKDLVDQFCKERNHFVPLQNTLLGNILDDQKWCGKKSSKGKNVYRGPQYDSAAGGELTCNIWFWFGRRYFHLLFAKYACGHANVLLDGAISKPFDPTR